MTKPRPNKDADYLEDLRCLERSVLDAMNLINFQWFLYDEARRKAWLEQQMTEPSDRQPESVPLAAGFKDRRKKMRRAANHGMPEITYQGENLRRGQDRRAPDRAA
jgi:hypothetical protein